MTVNELETMYNPGDAVINISGGGEEVEKEEESSQQQKYFFKVGQILHNVTVIGFRDREEAVPKSVIILVSVFVCKNCL